MDGRKMMLNPWMVYFAWLILFVVFICIGIPILNIGHSGGEQKPLILFAAALKCFFYGMMIISLIVPIFFLRWFKKYWYVSVIVLLISFYLVI